MPASCSNDLRWQIVWLVLGMRKSTREAAVLLSVTQTVFNILGRLRRNGNVQACRIGRPNFMVSISRGEAFMLMEYVMCHPGEYLSEAVDYIESICGREFSMSSVRRCLVLRDFTRKKVKHCYCQLRCFDTVF